MKNILVTGAPCSGKTTLLSKFCNIPGFYRLSNKIISGPGVKIFEDDILTTQIPYDKIILLVIPDEILIGRMEARAYSKRKRELNLSSKIWISEKVSDSNLPIIVLNSVMNLNIETSREFFNFISN